MSLRVIRVSGFFLFAAATFLFGVAGTSIGADENETALPPDVKEALDVLIPYLGQEDVVDAVIGALQTYRRSSTNGNMGGGYADVTSEIPLPAHPGPEQGVIATHSSAQSGIQVEGYKVLTAGPAPLVIPAAAFVPDGMNFNPGSYLFTFSGGWVQGGAERYGCLLASASLPDGVTLSELHATLYDNDPTTDVTVTLRRVDNFSGTATAMASVGTTGDFSGIQVPSTSAITEPVVVYPDYSYYVTTCLYSAAIRLYSVRLYYQ